MAGQRISREQGALFLRQWVESAPDRTRAELAQALGIAQGELNKALAGTAPIPAKACQVLGWRRLAAKPRRDQRGGRNRVTGYLLPAGSVRAEG
jgi:hypothetical protein